MIKTTDIKDLIVEENSYLSISNISSYISILKPPEKRTFSTSFVPAEGKTTLAQSKNKTNFLNMTSYQIYDIPSVSLNTFISSSNTLTSLNVSIGTEILFKGLKTKQKSLDELIISSGTYDDRQNVSVVTFSSNKINADDIQFKMITDNYLRLTICSSVPSISSYFASIKRSTFSTEKIDLHKIKNVTLEGKNFIDNLLVVLDENFDNVIGKQGLTQGDFLSSIQTDGSKVHVIAVPVDQNKNIIGIRNIDISKI